MRHLYTMYTMYDAPVHDIEEVLGELHLVRVLDVEVAAVLHVRLHFFPEIRSLILSTNIRDEIAPVIQ